jgi:hypothetical protein
MRSTMLTSALGLFLVASAATRADARWWSASGASCAVGDPAIQGNRYTIGAGCVKHRAGANGLITLYCAVNPGIGGLEYMNLSTAEDHAYVTRAGCTNGYVFRQTYADSDGAGAEASVRTQLIRMVKGNGDIYAVGGAALDSNGSGATVSTSLATPFDHTFDFQDFYYYVRVDLDRTAGSTKSAIFYGVALECRD